MRLGSEMNDWFLDDGFWEGLYGFMFPAGKFAAADAEIEKLLKLTAFEGRHVLDVACGPGRHSVPLARRGYAVTGIDSSRFLLNKAIQYSTETGANVEWIEADMRNFIRPNFFDLAISLFTSFGYFQKEEENFGVLQNIFGSLKPGGILVMDLIGKERMARNYQPTILHEMENGGLLIERPLIVDNWTRVRNQWILIRDSNVRRFHFQTFIYSGKELQSLLEQAGFSDVLLYGDLDGNPYGVDALRLVAVAKKV